MAYIGNRVATSGTSIKADKSAPANSLRVKSNGNIGVGVAEPSSKLHVAGTVTATAFAGDGSALTGIESLPAAIDVNGSAPDDSLAIDSAGKVGIGTTSPSFVLDARRNANDSLTRVNAQNPNAGSSAVTMIGLGNDQAVTASGLKLGSSTWSSGANTMEVFNNLSGSIFFSTGGVERMRINSAGKVGIGATSPTTSLEINAANTLGATFTGTTAGEGVEVSQTSYTVDNYVSLIEGKYLASQAAPHVRIGAQYTGGGSKLVFGTSNSYGSGITNSALTIDPSGDVLPGANGTQDFGSTSLRWANIYTSDLHLSNGIGNYTIVEGEEDLFLYNNKNGKTYKFMLAEVDPGEAPKKMEK